jgi:hypothetical protein
MGFPELLIIPFFLIGLAGAAFWIWMIIDCATNEPSAGNEKIVWIVIIVFAGFIGAAIYYFVRRNKRSEEPMALQADRP